jgi:hypothetical protein
MRKIFITKRGKVTWERIYRIREEREGTGAIG